MVILSDLCPSQGLQTIKGGVLDLERTRHTKVSTENPAMSTIKILTPDPTRIELLKH